MQLQASSGVKIEGDINLQEGRVVRALGWSLSDQACRIVSESSGSACGRAVVVRVHIVLPQWPVLEVVNADTAIRRAIENSLWSR